MAQVGSRRFAQRIGLATEWVSHLSEITATCRRPANIMRGKNYNTPSRSALYSHSKGGDPSQGCVIGASCIERTLRTLRGVAMRMLPVRHGLTTRLISSSRRLRMSGIDNRIWTGPGLRDPA